MRCDKRQTGQDGCVGENLWKGIHSQSSHIFPLKDMVVAWIDEKQWYHHDTNTCDIGQVCGHYTQVAWKDSTLVGCGKARKEDTTGVTVTLACNYAPAGNVVGKRPY